MSTATFSTAIARDDARQLLLRCTMILVSVLFHLVRFLPSVGTSILVSGTYFIFIGNDIEKSRC